MITDLTSILIGIYISMSNYQFFIHYDELVWTNDSCAHETSLPKKNGQNCNKQ